MMKLISTACVLAVCLSFACGKKDEKGNEKKSPGAESKSGDKEQSGSASKLDPGKQFMLDSARDNIKEAKEKLAAGTPEKAKFDCTTVMTAAKDLAGVTDEAVVTVVKEGEQLCGFDIPYATAEKFVKVAEEARKANPDKKMLSECFKADYNMAIADLKKKHADDEKVKALEARFAAACPK